MTKKKKQPNIVEGDGKEAVPDLEQVEIEIHCKYDKLIDPKKLKPHPANPSKHPEAQIKLLSNIIKEHGIRWPITVSNQSGFIVAGHCRCSAAIELGLKEYPVNYQNFKNNAEEMAVLVADNKIQEMSETDGLMMADILVELDQVNYPLELTALNEKEIKSYVYGPTNTPNIPDSQFGIVIICDNEETQKKLYDDTKKKGYECRLLTL